MLRQEALLPVAGARVEGDLPRLYILRVETQHAASLQSPTMRSLKETSRRVEPCGRLWGPGASWRRTDTWVGPYDL